MIAQPITPSSSNDEALYALIATPTEPKDTAAMQTQSAPVKRADFDDEPPQNATDDTEHTAKETERIRLSDLAELSDMADVVVEAVSMVQEVGLGWYYKTQKISNADYIRAKEMIAAFDKKRYVQDETDEDRKIISDYKEVAEYQNEVAPYSEAEKALLKKRLIPVMSQSGVKISPQSALIVTALMLTVPRLMPIIGEKFMNDD